MPQVLTIGALDLSDDFVAALAAEYDVTAWSPRRQPHTAPPPAHGVIAASMASACAASIVISAFADDSALWNATTAADGVLAQLPAGSVHVTIGLHDPTVIERVGREHERCARRFMAGPILLASAPERGAAVLGGAADAQTNVASVFAALGLSIAATCERPADAALLAITHSAMVACAMEAIAEAFALVRKFDVHPGVLRDVMSDALFAGTVYGPLADAILAETDDIVPSASRGVEILDLVLAAATTARVPLASVDACRDRLLSAIARGDGERAWTGAAREL